MRVALGTGLAVVAVGACQHGTAPDVGPTAAASGTAPGLVLAVSAQGTGLAQGTGDAVQGTSLAQGSGDAVQGTSLVQANRGKPNASKAPLSAPLGPATPDSLRFAVIGDFGDGSAAETDVARLVKSWQPDFVITTGDDNYPSGQAATIDAHIGAFYSDFIGNYHGVYGRGAATNRFWPTPGNHDWLAVGLRPYLEYFTLPGNERYYDVETGIVHLIALDSDPKEPDGTKPDSLQAKWTRERMLASKACFQVVFFHHPPYSSGPHGDAVNMQWPFRALGAVAVLAGHDHVYERFDIEGIPYIVNGLGGADRYPFRSTSRTTSVVRYNERHGAMRVVASREEIAFQFWNVDGKKIDEVRIPKRCPVSSDR